MVKISKPIEELSASGNDLVLVERIQSPEARALLDGLGIRSVLKFTGHEHSGIARVGLSQFPWEMAKLYYTNTDCLAECLTTERDGSGTFLGCGVPFVLYVHSDRYELGLIAAPRPYMDKILPFASRLPPDVLSKLKEAEKAKNRRYWNF